jgi:hypothetical protein
MMTAGTAHLAFELDIFKNSLYYNAGQRNFPPKKENEKTR